MTKLDFRECERRIFPTLCLLEKMNNTALLIVRVIIEAAQGSKKTTFEEVFLNFPTVFGMHSHFNLGVGGKSLCHRSFYIYVIIFRRKTESVIPGVFCIYQPRAQNIKMYIIRG